MMKIVIFLVFLLMCLSCNKKTKTHADALVKDNLQAYEKYRSDILPDSLLPLMLRYKEKAVLNRDYESNALVTEVLVNRYMLRSEYQNGFSCASNFLHTVLKSKDSTFVAKAYFHVGRLYYGLGLSEIALGYFLNMAKYNLSPADRSRALYAIAETSRYSHKANGLDPFEYYSKSEAIARQIKDSARIASCLFGKSQMYFNSLSAHERLGTPMKEYTMDSIHKSTEFLNEALRYNGSFYVIHCALGLNYASMKLWKQAQIHVKEGYELTRKIPDVVPLGLNVLASYSICTGKYNDAILHGKQSYELAGRMNKKGDMANAASIMYFAYKCKNDAVNALKSFERYSDLSNKMSEKDREIRLVAIQVQYDTKLKEEQLAHLTVKNKTYRQLILLVSVCFLLVSAALVVAYVLYRKKQIAYRELVRKNLEWARTSIVAGDDNTSAISSNFMNEAGTGLMDRMLILIEKDKIYENPDISLDWLSNELNVNRVYISQAINQYSGKHFNAFLNEYRVKAAINYMSATKYEQMTIEEIAYKCGFNDRKTFYRAFLKITGVSPSVFRKNSVSV